MSAPRILEVLVALVVSAAFLGSATPAGAMEGTRGEAESLPSTDRCWSLLTYLRLSGGQGRACMGSDIPLSWAVNVPSGEEGTVRLYGYRDTISRDFRVRIDGGAWTTGSLRGAEAASALFYTSPRLSPGRHTVDLEWVASPGGFTFDFYELETFPPSSASTTTTLSPTTTTAPPVTTTTAPVTPTTAPPTPGGVCHISPADGEAAIAAAIRACPDGSTVMFPAGRTYHQTDKILVKSRKDLIIDGNGSTFFSRAPNDPWATIYQARPNWEVVEGTNVSLRNMTIRGNLPPGPRGILPGNQYNAGIIIYGGEGVSIIDVSIYSVYGEFVVSNPSGFHHGGGALDGEVPTNVRITRLRGEHAGRQCVSATAAQGFWLQDSTLAGCQQNGVDIEPDVAGERIRDVHVLRNTISGYYFSAVTVPTAYQAGDVDGVEIRGNHTPSPSDTCYPAVLLGEVQGNANPLMNIVVADNTLRTLYDGVRATHVSSGTVTGNTITVTGSPNYCGPPVGVPVKLINSPNVTVASNGSNGYGT